MVLKGIALYMALYMAGAASSVMAVRQLVPAKQAVLPAWSDAAIEARSFSGQVVNLAAKGDRLQIRHRKTQLRGKERIEAPGLGIPKATSFVTCAHSPTDLKGRCFAGARSASQV